jgi:hypothetical protein
MFRFANKGSGTPHERSVRKVISIGGLVTGEAKCSTVCDVVPEIRVERPWFYVVSIECAPALRAELTGIAVPQKHGTPPSFVLPSGHRPVTFVGRTPAPVSVKRTCPRPSMARIRTNRILPRLAGADLERAATRLTDFCNDLSTRLC